MTPILIGIAAFLIGLFVGLAVWYYNKSRSQSEMMSLRVQLASLEEQAHATAAEHAQWVETMEHRMRDDFQVLASDALKSNSDVLNLMVKREIQTAVEPLCDHVRNMEQIVRTLETDTTQAQTELRELLMRIRATQSERRRAPTTGRTPMVEAPGNGKPELEERPMATPDRSARAQESKEELEDAVENITQKQTWLRKVLWTHLSKYKLHLMGAGIFTLGVALAALLVPWPLKIILDHLVPGLSEEARGNGPLQHLLARIQGEPMTILPWAAASILIIALFGALCSYVQVRITTTIGFKLINSLRQQLFAHLQRLSLSSHNRARSGDLLVRVSDDTKSLCTFFTDDLLNFASQILTVIAMLVVMVMVDWPVGLLAVATVPLLCVAMLQMYRATKKSARRQRRNEGDVTARLDEMLTSMPLVQADGRERYEDERLEHFSKKTLKQTRLEAVAGRSTDILTAVGLAATIFFAGYRVLQGLLTPGDLILFTYYLRQMYKPIRGMASFFINYSRAASSAERISDVLEIEPEVNDSPRAVEARNVKGRITFENVSFAYGDSKGVLREVSFSASPGQRLALVGNSGAGKSTIASLLLRLCEPQKGSISVDSVDIRNYRVQSLRRQIDIVLQQSLLFPATIRENIAYGRPEATDLEILAAARAANAHEFIRELENGYDTEVGEGGVTLSAGQRQRIAIARALISDAPILILDEPTTGLDVESEARVREALGRLMANKTSIMITHNLQSLADADTVLLLDQGRIVERGKHSDLLAHSERYRHLHELDLQQPAPAVAA